MKIQSEFFFGGGFGFCGFCGGRVLTGFCVVVVLSFVGATVGFGFSLATLGVGEGIGETLGVIVGEIDGEIVGVAVEVEITGFAAGLFAFAAFEPFNQTIPPMPPTAKIETAAIGNIQNNPASDFDSDLLS